ncbi:MAG TPA: VOC family protein [Opitutaceae bacterium]
MTLDTSRDTSGVSSVRPGFPTASPYLVFNDPEQAIDFYHQALGAVELSRQADADGRIRHVEFRVGDSTFMATTTNSEFPFMRSAEEMGGSPVQFFLYVEGVDARFQRALDAGAEVVMPVADQTYGRSGGFKDPFGIIWWLSTYREPEKTVGPGGR